MATSAGMTVVLAVMAAMVSIDSKPAGIVASVMLFLFEAFYAWGFMGPIWVRLHLFFSLDVVTAMFN